MNKIKSVIVKRNKAYSSGKIELFGLLKAQVPKEIKKAKSTLYDKKVRPKRTACSKSWWKQIKRLTGKEKGSVRLVDPEIELELNNKNQPLSFMTSSRILLRTIPR
jgi:hypothetical protein